MGNLSLITTLEHFYFFDHGRPLHSSQILPNSPPTPSPFSFSVESKQTEQTKTPNKLEFLKNQRKKNTRNTHTHKHHINTKSETITHKQRTSTFSAFLPEARHQPSFLPAQNLERLQSLYGGSSPGGFPLAPCFPASSTSLGELFFVLFLSPD